MSEDTNTEAGPTEASKSGIERGQFKKYAEKYGSVGHNGDPIATAFAAFAKVDGKVSLERLATVAAANGIDLSRWAGRNVGMQRMNLGNALRGLHNKGKDVVIGEETIPGAAPKVKATEDSSAE